MARLGLVPLLLAACRWGGGAGTASPATERGSPGAAVGSPTAAAPPAAPLEVLLPLAEVRGAIAFVSGRTGTVQLWVMDADGADPVQLTEGPGTKLHPAWSPDGRSLVFAEADRGLSDPNFDLYVVGADGLERLTETPTREASPAWSPDGTTIAFSSNRGGGDHDIWAMEVDGGGLRRLTRASGLDLNPAWSPDGRFIAFTSLRDGNYEIYVMRADGSHERNLTRDPANDYTPAWRPPPPEG